jgi:cyclophilin family peptidyl-prolyl cis-trans isomerase
MAKQYNAPPEMQIEPDKNYTATLKTAKGDIVVDLFAKEAPVTVNNFVFLARDGFYDDTTFHRVINGFMAQAGDPTGTGRGGPGYKFADEQSALALGHDGPGILSMANAGPNTNGSQFFITHKATPHLNGKHAVFGKVRDQESIDTLLSISERDPMSASEPGDKLLTVEIAEA